jgi:hypothetical protein
LLKKDFLGYIFDQAIIAAKKVGPDPDTTIEKKNRGRTKATPIRDFGTLGILS